MSYGYSVQAPMVVDRQPMVSQYTAELAEVPKIDPTSANSVRLQSALTKRMPSVSEVSAYGNAKAREAEELATGMRVAFRETRIQNKRSEKISKAKNRAQERIAQRKTKLRRR